MKKNTMMRIASFLLIAVLLSTSAISGTYAKYVTADFGGDQARVAKWGVVTTVKGSLFADTYYSKDDGNDPKDGTTITVNSFSNAKVVAPGTNNYEGITFTLTGTPEVKVDVDFSFVVNAEKEIMLKEGNYTDDPTTGAETADPFNVSKNYYPVIFTLKAEGVAEPLVSGNVTAIQNYLTTLSHEYDAKFDLATIVPGCTTGKYTLTWEWPFQNTVPAGDKVDSMDTFLGNAASVPTTGATTEMDVTLTCTVTQVD